MGRGDLCLVAGCQAGWLLGALTATNVKEANTSMTCVALESSILWAATDFQTKKE
jgi:hypothetical protein